jgi:chloramphenicol-sensitive protein RarD
MNSDVRRGTAFGALAYLLWGAFPLYFRLLDASGPIEILLHRILWSLLICIAVLAALRSLAQLGTILRSPRTLSMLAAAAVLIAINWGVYIKTVNDGNVVEAALGYFINPLVTVALGVVVLRERLRRLQWVAVAIGAVAVVVLAAGYGRPPWIALILASSFGAYGLLKKQVGGTVGALAGLTTETLVLAPVAVAVLIWLELSGRGTFTVNAPWQGLLLASAGFVTVAPLLLFAASARRVPLVTIGLLQFMTPVLQLLCGVVLLGEHVPAIRWAGFVLVWVALLVLTADSLAAARRERRVVAAEREGVRETLVL